MNVAAHAGAALHLPEQDGAAIPKLRNEMAELMAGIGHGDRLHPRRQDISRKSGRQRLRVEVADVEPQLRGERVIESQQPRFGDRHRVDPREEAFRQTGITAAIHELD